MVLGRKTEVADNASLNFSFRITRVDLDDQSSSGSKILFLHSPSIPLYTCFSNDGA